LRGGKTRNFDQKKKECRKGGKEERRRPREQKGDCCVPRKNAPRAESINQGVVRRGKEENKAIGLPL